jgi:hypothetical protein
MALLLLSAASASANASLLNCHYFVKDHQSLANTSKTASDFFGSLDTNLTSRMDNRSFVHVKGLALRNGWIDYPADLFLNGSNSSNISGSFSWKASWAELLPEMTSKMVDQVVKQLGEETKYGAINADAILAIDYEPRFRPSWNFTIGEGAAHHDQPAWSALLTNVHSKRLDVDWISLVGWICPPGVNTTATKWDDLTKTQKRSLEEASWNYFVRKYLVTAIGKIKAEPKLAGLRLGFWDWPYKFWFLPAVKEAPPRWQQWMDELGWLWSELDVFLPDVYPEFFAGSESDKPSVLAKCTTQNASATAWYYTAILTESLRLKQRFQPTATVVLVGWYHYMCSHLYDSGQQLQDINIGYFVHDNNLDALFLAASAGAEVALWGSIGAPPDDQPAQLRSYLDAVYGPVVRKYCRPNERASRRDGGSELPGGGVERPTGLVGGSELTADTYLSAKKTLPRVTTECVSNVTNGTFWDHSKCTGTCCQTLWSTADAADCCRNCRDGAFGFTCAAWEWDVSGAACYICTHEVLPYQGRLEGHVTGCIEGRC